MAGESFGNAYREQKAFLALCIIYFIAGFLMVIVGIYGAANYSWGSTLLGFKLPWGVFGVGMGLITMNIIGLYGMRKANRNCLIVYLVLLLVTIACQIWLAVEVVQKNGKLTNQMRLGWTDLPVETRTLIENEFTCCGFYNSTDLPGTRCSTLGDVNPQPEGCFTKARNYMLGKMTWVYVLGILAFILEFATVVTVGILIRKWARRRHMAEEEYQDEEANPGVGEGPGMGMDIFGQHQVDYDSRNPTYVTPAPAPVPPPPPPPVFALAPAPIPAHPTYHDEEGVPPPPDYNAVMAGYPPPPPEPTAPRASVYYDQAPGYPGYGYAESTEVRPPAFNPAVYPPPSEYLIQR